MYVVEYMLGIGGFRRYRAYRPMEHWYIELMDHMGGPGGRLLRVVFDTVNGRLARSVISELFRIVGEARGVVEPDALNRALARLFEAEYGDAMPVRVLSEFKDVTPEGVLGGLYYSALLG